MSADLPHISLVLLGSASSCGIVRRHRSSSRSEDQIQNHHGQCRRDAEALIPLAVIPVILVDLDDVHATQLGLAMDARYGHYDDAMLSGLIQDLETQHTDLDDTGLPPFDVDRLLREDYIFSLDWNPEPEMSAGAIISDPSAIISETTAIKKDAPKDPETPEFDPASSLTHVRITIIAPRAKLAVMSAILDRWDEDPEVRISMTDARS
jgi:hypothetical protein